MMLSLMLDYVRMVSYAVIILTSINCATRKRFGAILFVGDALISAGLLITLILSNFLNVKVIDTADWVLTPLSVLWAVLHFYTMLKGQKEFI